MATISKYSDYIIHSIEWFISSIKAELDLRDISGLTSGHIELVTVSKQHPLVTLMVSQLSEVSNGDPLQNGLLPAISVTPGNMPEGAFTLGMSPRTETIDDTFIDRLKYFLALTDKEIQKDLLISKNQIETIIGEYNKAVTGGMKTQINQWSRGEEINISVWTETPDEDILLGNLMDSMLSGIRTGFMGDDSPIRDLKFNINKGLTNFNYGRAIFGTEYNLTFLNSFNNYIIYTDDVISGNDFYGTYKIPGDE